WQDGRLRDIGSLAPGFPGAGATAINSQGLVVGWTGVPSGEQHAFLWRDGLGMIDLNVGPGLSRPTGISDAAAVVGVLFPSDGAEQRGFIWSGGLAVDLASLLPADAGWASITPTGISPSGQIVGI